jgi:peroxiredoxin (alkyl hydroperoxide reductase subunit C)
VFAIDPKGMIRAILYYPMSLGRNVEELLRIFAALQTADSNACSTPANWKPGDKVVVPAPPTQADAEARVKTPGLEIMDWYLSKRELAGAAKR